MSERGIPYSYRHMHGFGSHTFSMINAKNERFRHPVERSPERRVTRAGSRLAGKISGELDIV
jgi:catalase